MKKVLFLCTGNSCRSQIAEAVVNHRLKESWQAYSAGTFPTGYVHPKAVQVLEEMGIHHEGESKHVEKFRHDQFDLVVTVCNYATEDCPLWLGSGKRIHRSFNDPAKARGSDEQVINVFRQVRDEIAEEIPKLLENY